MLHVTVAVLVLAVKAGIEPAKEPKFKGVADTVQAAVTVTDTLKLLVLFAAKAPLAAATRARPATGRRYLRMFITSVKIFPQNPSDNWHINTSDDPAKLIQVVSFTQLEKNS